MLFINTIKCYKRLNQYYLIIVNNLYSFIFQLKLIMENWDPVTAQIGKCNH